LRHRFYLVAFNHLTPFPGTPLYQRLDQEQRLLFERWWLDPAYRYGMVPFRTDRMSALEVEETCVRMRSKFYSLKSMLRRSLDPQVNANNFFMWTRFFTINWLMRREVLQRKGFPLGDASDHTRLVPSLHATAAKLG